MKARPATSMVEKATGRVLGDTIALDDRVPGLNGARVRIILEPIEESEECLSEETQARLWAEWAIAGLDGPISDEDAFAP